MTYPSHQQPGFPPYSATRGTDQPRSAAGLPRLPCRAKARTPVCQRHKLYSAESRENLGREGAADGRVNKCRRAATPERELPICPVGPSFRTASYVRRSSCGLQPRGKGGQSLVGNHAAHSTTSSTRASFSQVSSRTANPHSRRRCASTSAVASVSGRPRRRMMPQRQRAVAVAVVAHDLDVGNADLLRVLLREQLAHAPVAALVVDAVDDAASSSSA